MFEFRNGMLGVTIIALAIAGAVFGSYLAGIESVDHEVIKYRELADMNGAYTYDQNPQYIDFDPSTNYTGYYSEDSGEYFASDDVGFTENSNVNNYRINLTPEETDVGETTLTGLETVNITDVTYADYKDGRAFIKAVNDEKTIRLSTLLDALDPDQQYDTIRLNSLENASDIDNVFGQLTEVDWCNFYLVSDLVDGGISDGHIRFCSPAYWDYIGDSGGRSVVVIPSLSALIDRNSDRVTLFFNNDYTNPRGSIYAIDDVLITFGGAEGSNPNILIIFGTSLDYDMIKSKPAEYMDPNKGVWLL